MDRTGWPPGLLQDDSRELSRWFASKPDARRLAREAGHAALMARLPPYRRCQGPHALLPPWHDYWGLDRIGSLRRCEAWARREAERVMKEKVEC